MGCDYKDNARYIGLTRFTGVLTRVSLHLTGCKNQYCILIILCAILYSMCRK